MLLGVRNAAVRFKALVGNVRVQTEACMRGVLLLGQTCCYDGRLISALQTVA